MAAVARQLGHLGNGEPLGGDGVGRPAQAAFAQVIKDELAKRLAVLALQGASAAAHVLGNGVHRPAISRAAVTKFQQRRTSALRSDIDHSVRGGATARRFYGVAVPGGAQKTNSSTCWPHAAGCAFAVRL
jgi:hypothetical protein